MRTIGCVLAVLLLASCATGSRRNDGLGSAKTRIAKRGSPDSEAETEKEVRTLAHYATGLSYELNDKPELALDQFVEAAQSDPGYEPVVVEAARRCIRGNKPDKAIDILLKSTAQPQASGTMYAWLGLAYARAGKTDLAVAANRTAIKKMPQALPAYQNLAEVYLESGKTNEALNVLDEASRQPVESPGFLIDLADLYLRYGRAQTSHGEAIKQRLRQVLDRAADLNPSSPIEIMRLGDYYFGLNELTKAERLYRQLLEEHSDFPSVRGKLAEIYLRSGQKDKASEQLKALAEDDPTNAQAYLVLGALAVDQERYPEAAEHFDRAIRLNPDLEEVYYNLAGLKLTMRKPEEALACLDKARARFKLSFPLEFYTGVAYGRLEKYQDALKYLISAEAIANATEPSRLDRIFYFQIGSTYERSGNIQEAEKYFRRALKLAPDDAETLNYLGYMWAEHGVHLEEAQLMIEKALRQKPDSAAYLDSLAWVLFKLNKPKEALPHLLRALKQPEKPDPTLYDHLGDIYSALKDNDRAREAWSKALRVDPEAEEKLPQAVRHQIEQKLQGSAPASHPAP